MKLLSFQLDCSDTQYPFYPWDAVREAEYVLRDHDHYYPLYLQVNFPQLRADYPGQVPPEYLLRASNIPGSARQVFGGKIPTTFYEQYLISFKLAIFLEFTSCTHKLLKSIEKEHKWALTHIKLHGKNEIQKEGGTRIQVHLDEQNENK